MIQEKQQGDPYGTHRVIQPKGVLPQPADRIDNTMDIMWDNEIRINVEALNIDSASFAQIRKQAGDNENAIKKIILDIVNTRGKMHNPVTGSGGMLMGKVDAIGSALAGKRDLKKGDAIASLVSLSLTPLCIDEIQRISIETDQVMVSAKAVLFESGIYAKLPDDIPKSLALAALDVAGAPAQTAQLVKPGDVVMILGATGKSGVLCAYVAQKMAGESGMVIGSGTSEASVEKLKSLELCHTVVKLDATDAVACYRSISAITSGKLADLVINCVNVPNTELASILMCRDSGTVYFFSMATSFTKAALGAEGVGKDVSMIIGNGYTKGHADYTLNILRESRKIRQVFFK